MVLEFFRGNVDQPLEEIESLIVGMLNDSRHTFDLAINAVVGGTDAAAVGKEIRKSDRKVNKAEREVRRQIVVQISVRGERVDVPHVLAWMSIIKDAERIGDYAKNIWDLAAAGVDLSGAEDTATWLAYRDRTSHLIANCARIFSERDADAAHEILPGLDDALDEYDAIVENQFVSEGRPRDAVSRALLSRYLKRITAHAMNVLTSLVMPIERLDYYDEKKADRW